MLTLAIVETVEVLEKILDGAEEGNARSSAIADRCNNLIKLISGMTFDRPDAIAGLEIVSKYQRMLGDENAACLQAAISQMSNTLLTQANETPTHVPRLQEHMHIEEYFTDTMWGFLRSSKPISSKLIKVAEFVVDILGLHFPDEMTYASIAGVIIAAHGKPLSFATADDILKEFKQHVKEQRKKRRSTRTFLQFPASVSEFMRVQLGRCSIDAQPVHCPLASDILASGRYLVTRDVQQDQCRLPLDDPQGVKPNTVGHASMHCGAGAPLVSIRCMSQRRSHVYITP